jgi:hypothetical protein
VLAGTTVIPYSGSGFVVGDDDEYTWQLDRWCNQTQLVVKGYNTGVYPHTFYFKAEWEPNEPGLTATASLAANSVSSDQTAAAVAQLAQAEPDDEVEPDLSTVSL